VRLRWIDRPIILHGVDEDQRAKLAEIAEKTPVTRAVRAGTEIRTTTGAARPVAMHATERSRQWGVLIKIDLAAGRVLVHDLAAGRFSCAAGSP